MLLDAVADVRIAPAHPELLNRPVLARIQRLADMRLLMVEDNLNSQQAAQELLEEERAGVGLADNGELGVAAAAAADPPFDALLMDLQIQCGVVLTPLDARRCAAACTGAEAGIELHRTPNSRMKRSPSSA